MPNLYRITILFTKRTGDPVGHSERWDFLIGSDQDAKAFAQVLASRRATFLPFDWKISGVRVGTLSAFRRVDLSWRFKQVSIALCLPPTVNGTLGSGEIDGGAVYYRFSYTGAPGKAAVRLFTPVYESYWDGSSTGGRDTQAAADGDILPYANWLINHGHVLARIDKSAGTITTYPLSCVQFKRAAIKKVGRPFELRRGRRFAHRTHRP